MKIVCWQTILMKYHSLFFWKLGKMLQNLLFAAVEIGALSLKSANHNCSRIFFAFFLKEYKVQI